LGKSVRKYTGQIDIADKKKKEKNLGGSYVWDMNVEGRGYFVDQTYFLDNCLRLVGHVCRLQSKYFLYHDRDKSKIPCFKIYFFVNKEH